MVRVDKNSLWTILAVFLLIPLDAECQGVAPPQPQSEHPADIAARALQPWETDLVEPSSWIDAIDWGHGQDIGVRKNEGGVLKYELWGIIVGVEQWEDGERTRLRQRWEFSCLGSDPVTAREQPICTLDREALIAWPGFPPVGTTVSTDSFSTLDGTLVFRRLAWEAGILNFSLLVPNRPSTEVSVIFSYDGDLMTLRSLRATTVSTPHFSDSEVKALEFRVPEYSYTWYAPFPMRGVKSSAHRRWNELIDQLSDEDRQVWDRLVQRGQEFAESLQVQDPEKEVRDLLEATLGRNRAQQLEQADAQATPEEEQRLQTAMNQEWLDGFRTWVAEGGMSADGQRRVMEYLRQAARRERENVR